MPTSEMLEQVINSWLLTKDLLTIKLEQMDQEIKTLDSLMILKEFGLITTSHSVETWNAQWLSGSSVKELFKDNNSMEPIIQLLTTSDLCWLVKTSDTHQSKPNSTKQHGRWWQEHSSIQSNKLTLLFPKLDLPHQLLGVESFLFHRSATLKPLSLDKDKKNTKLLEEVI